MRKAAIPINRTFLAILFTLAMFTMMLAYMYVTISGV